MAAERRAWSRLEVEAIVADYFAMLELELRGEPYTKAEHRRMLKEQLDRRSDGSIEYKHQNISAVLIELGLPYIEGYKPAGNYQDLLFDVVAGRVAGAAPLLEAVQAEVERPARMPSVDDILSRLVAVPERDPARPYKQVRERALRPVTALDYLMREARNASLGDAGERFVLDFERARLLAGREDRLASRVEHVSKTRGDHEGFDVLSFDADGRERLIEVKTTAFGPFTPFYVSSNQVTRSRADAERYHVYRLFRFRKDPRLFSLPGALEESVRLEPREYVARLM